MSNWSVLFCLSLRKPLPNLLLLLHSYYNLSSGLPEVIFACKAFHISADYILITCDKKEGHQYKPQVLYIWHSFQQHLLTCSFKVSMICTNLSGWDTPLINTNREKKSYASVQYSVNKDMLGPHNLREAEARKEWLNNCRVRWALKRIVSCSASFLFTFKNWLGCFPKIVNSFQRLQIIPHFKYECQWTHSKSSSNVRKDYHVLVTEGRSEESTRF